MHSCGLGYYPEKVLVAFARKARKLAGADDSQALLLPSKEGWSSERGISVDLWAFQIVFHWSSELVCDSDNFFQKH